MTGSYARRAWAEPVMGTVASIHVVGAACDDARTADAVAGCLVELRDLERVFSPFRADSDISRIRTGALTVADADPRVAVVAQACTEASVVTEGRFSAWWRGWFDPTGYVKGWAVDEASAHHLAALLDHPGIAAIGVSVGGDMRLRTAADAAWTWHVGIADPERPGETLATVDVRNGAVATSGTADRGAHIIDPRTGAPVDRIRSATVVADDLATADVWATAAVVAGADLGWIRRAPETTGMLVGADGAVRRWIAGAEVTVSAAA